LVCKLEDTAGTSVDSLEGIYFVLFFGAVHLMFKSRHGGDRLGPKVSWVVLFSSGHPTNLNPWSLDILWICGVVYVSCDLVLHW
jgi:hypothetical protein